MSTILAGAGVVASTTNSVAGTIRIDTDVRASVNAGKLALAMKIRNSGDEAARSIVAAARFGGGGVRAPARPALGPGTAMDVALELPWTETLPGQWPLTATVDYGDVNGHAFQALHVSVVASPDASPALIAILEVHVTAVSASGEMTVRLRSLSPLPRDARLGLLVPRGLEVDAPVRPLPLAPWADAEVKARIINRAALPEAGIRPS